MSIEYVHRRNPHTVSGAAAALPYIFADWRPKSLLDVGCGPGTWLKAALDFGIADVFGLDGVDVPQEEFLVSASLRKLQDLTKFCDLRRRFDVVLCLEVAEHLNKRYESLLVKTLVTHSDYIVFSAACPAQGGQHHVNCQWPAYWQALFNEHGFSCADGVRWRMWNDGTVEPWYRQNLFIAQRDVEHAGLEPRLHPVLHPEGGFVADIRAIENGRMRLGWYLWMPLYAVSQKGVRCMNRMLQFAR